MIHINIEIGSDSVPKRVILASPITHGKEIVREVGMAFINGRGSSDNDRLHPLAQTVPQWLNTSTRELMRA